MLPFRYFIVFALSVPAAACDGRVPGNDAIDCTASIEPGVIVEIRDSRTGAPLGDSARGVVRDGAFVDSLSPAGGTTEGGAPQLHALRAADERPGTNVVEVRHPGYRAWDTSGVLVPAGVCHVRTQHLRARLDPAS